jgi:acyl-CoA synthetase (NDP forming)
MADPGVDMCLFIMATFRLQSLDFPFFKELKQAYPDKPLAIFLIGRKEAVDHVFRQIEGLEIPVFFTIPGAVKALALLYRRRRFLEEIEESPQEVSLV